MKLLVVFIHLTACMALAAIGNIYQTPQKKLNQYHDEGVFIGGEAGNGFSLISIRRNFSEKSKIERLVLDIGELDGKPLKGKVNYFNIGLEAQPPRIIIDLAQVHKSGVAEVDLKKIFSNSFFVKNADITYDPEDGSTNLTLILKHAVEVDVFTLPSETQASRIVVDVRKK